MREVIDRILDEKFEYENGGLDFSETRIEIHLQAGKNYEGSFRVIGRKGYITKGFIYTSDRRMECLTGEFFGSGEEIGYVFHGKGMESGDVLQGNFYIVSNRGEYTLPFVVMVSKQILKTDLGAMKNLFHFANLAKSNWAEAVSLFYSPGFSVLFEGNDRKYKGLYRGLSRYYGNERNVEEFLIAVHKKQRTNYIIDEDKLRLEDVAEGIGRHEVLVTKNGWGYIYLQVEVQGDFLTVDKTALSDDDFLGDRCHFYYYVDRDKLHKGINYGKLRFYNSFVETSVPIEVKVEDEDYRQGLTHRKKQDLLVSIMEYYGAFRMKKISTRTWLTKNHEILDSWGEMDDADPEPKLYRAHLLITEGRMNEAGWMLDQARNAILQSRDMDNAVWCYYLYLSTLRGKDENYVNKIAEEVASSYEKDPENWRLGWLLLYLSPEYGMSCAKKWMFIRQQFERGCNSPVFYIEALLLIKTEPSLFMELGDFEIQMLRYAAKHDLLTDEIIMQLHYLAPRSQDGMDRILDILKKSYDRRPDTETLQNICTLLIRGNCRGKENFPWYAAGVEENLRITKLYEYYMYSLDMENMIRLPKVIYMYFAYHNNLDWERSAYLYASLLEYKDFLPDLYEKERLHMQEFVVQMIQKGLINRHLAYLYKKLIRGDVMLMEVGEKLAPLLFSVHASVTDKRMRRLLLLYNRETTENSFALNNGQAVLPLYGEEYTILLEDDSENRYVPDENFKMERLFAEDGLLAKAQELDFGTVSLQMYLCGVGQTHITEDNIRRFERLLADSTVDADYKQTIIPGMAQFYFDHDKMEELDAFLDGVSPALLDASRRGEIIHYLVLRKKYEKATDWIREYGVNGISPKTVLRLSSGIIQASGKLEDKTILSMCFYAFQKGKADIVTLDYLMEYYQGSAKVLRDIWKSAKEKGMDIHDFSERILVQMLYSGGFVGEVMDIFRAYIERDTDVSLEKAFLYQCCYNYFIKNIITDTVIFEEVERLLRTGEQMAKVCILAYTRYYAENRRKLRKEGQDILAENLYKLVEDGVILPYYLEYADICPWMRRYCDKTILEYRTRPGRKAFLHYMIEQEEGDFKKIEMKEVYEGVFSSMFVLFFGEELLYYTEEEYEDKNGRRQEITGSGTISRGDTNIEAYGSRFHMLNDIMIAEVLQDYDTLDDTLKEYERTDALQRALFQTES